MASDPLSVILIPMLNQFENELTMSMMRQVMADEDPADPIASAFMNGMLMGLLVGSSDIVAARAVIDWVTKTGPFRSGGVAATLENMRVEADRIASAALSTL